MGVALTLYQGNISGLIVQVNELEYGFLQANTTQNYKLNVYEQEAVNVSLVTHTYQGQPVFIVSKCTIVGCTPILAAPDGIIHF